MKCHLCGLEYDGAHMCVKVESIRGGEIVPSRIELLEAVATAARTLSDDSALFTDLYFWPTPKSQYYRTATVRMDALRTALAALDGEGTK